MDDLIKLIAKSVRQRRLLKNISQEKLADLCGISLASITRLETGRGNISLNGLIAVLSVLDMKDAISEVFSEGGIDKGEFKNERVKWSKNRRAIIHEDQLGS
jgi:transcriptional regulator with XRE-family HTH domain